MSVARRFLVNTCIACSGLLSATHVTAQDDAYLDAGARRIVELARERRASVDRSIVRYQTTVQERISAGLRTVGRERLLYRRETAGRIDWKREGEVEIEVLGAREVVPPVMRGAQVPEDLTGFMPHLAFDPMESEMLVRMDTTSIRHPLVSGSEAHYRFRSGDTTTIRLPDGRAIRLIELIVIPRRDEFQLMTGSFWIDADTHAVVRVVFRPARPFDLARDGDEDDDDVPGFLQPIRAELLYITLEYGLWDLRWWLPRVMAAEGTFQMSFVTMPLQYERRYSAYEIEADTTLPRMPIDSLPQRNCTPRMRLVVDVGENEEGRRRRQERREERRAEQRAERDSMRADSLAGEENECPQQYAILIPDSSALLTSELLPDNVYSDDAELLTVSELESIGEQLGQLPQAPWQLRAPTFGWGFGAPGMLRYNRIEALSIGARTQLDLGRLQADLTARVGVADLEPNADLVLRRETPGSRISLTAYRRLAAANPDTKPLATGNSLGALLLGRDDGEYFRAGGAELRVQPGLSATQWYDLRLYGERQWRADVETDFSLRHVLNDDYAFRPNLRALDADQFGATLALRTSNGLDPAGFRWGAELSLTGETGTFEFARPGITLRAATPLPFDLLAGAEVAGGTSTGDVPPQSLWFLGGPATLRGYHGGITSGNAYWRSRLELSTQFPAARVVIFSDAGWAGDRNDFDRGRPLIAAGAGASFLDGLIRFDLARALRNPTGWRLDFYVSGAL